MGRKKTILNPSFADKFQTYLDKCGALLDEYKVPRELIDKLASLDIDIQAEIEENEITSDFICELLANDIDDLREDVVFDMHNWCKKEDWESIAGDMDIYTAYSTIKVDSLAEKMKFEAFKEQLQENPYQLRIA